MSVNELYEFRMKGIDGGERTLDVYRGKALLIVNVASRCGLTPQYTALEKLYRDRSADGLVVLGFPCNQFGGQEPGTDQEVKTFCETSFGVTFPLFSKIDVNGERRAPLYRWLTGLPTRPDGPGDVSWNFAKFVVGRKGEVVARFSPQTKPDAPEVLAAIRTALAG